ncbi:TolC family protein [Hymenobacter sp. H14-R3]|uniref:TolC family protein n=1 Tax=Hymenobacter sp. H14-R3 TaxID=3046308 RepID=UPI0024BAB048|nr:TolC family protein [Hymenobacter sp. H14-R3]MDJ0365385.1 TolC family protein [Hymenobacter sp. H14-R3]
MTAPSTHRLCAALGLAGLLAAGPLAAQTTQPERPASPPAAALPSAAAATGPWTLQRAIDYALAHNLSVRLNQLTAQSNAQVLRQSKAALLPTVNLNATQGWNYGTYVNPVTSQFQNATTRSNNFAAQGQLVIFQGFVLRNTIKRNDLDYEASMQDIEKARNDLSLNVASQFLQLVLAQELVRANTFYVERDQQQIARTKLLLKAGSIPESTLLDSQSQLATDELNVITSQNQVSLARLALLQLLNIDPATAQGFEINVPPLPDPDQEDPLQLDLNAVYQTAASTRPEIQAADLRVRSARRSVDIARGSYYPRLFLNGSLSTLYSSAGVSRKLTGDSTTRYLPVLQRAADGTINPAPFVAFAGKQPNFEELPPRFFGQLGSNYGKAIQFVLSVPILNGLQVRTNVQRAIINEQSNAVRAEQARLTLRQSIEQAYADARAAQLQYAAATRQVTALTLTQRNSEIRFNNGLLNGTEFNIAKNNLNFAVSNQLQAKYTFIFRRKVLDFYQGKPLAL